MASSHGVVAGTPMTNTFKSLASAVDALMKNEKNVRAEESISMTTGDIGVALDPLLQSMNNPASVANAATAAPNNGTTSLSSGDPFKPTTTATVNTAATYTIESNKDALKDMNKRFNRISERLNATKHRVMYDLEKDTERSVSLVKGCSICMSANNSSQERDHGSSHRDRGQ